MKRLLRFGPLLVGLGTFSIPIAQWSIFWLLGRTDGVESAGQFAFMLAIATPVFVLTNFGLRNGYITIAERYPFAAFGFLRVFGNAVGSLLVIAIALTSGLAFGLVIAVVGQKIADGFLDILYGRFQRARRLFPFGLTMVVNGVTTIFLAAVLARSGVDGDLIVASTAAGSWIALTLGLILSWRIKPLGLRASARLVSPGVPVLVAIAGKCWPIGGSQVLAALTLNIPIWVVAAGGSAVETGRFSGAAYILTASWLVGSALSSTHIGDYRVRMLNHGSQSVARVAARDAALATSLGLLVVFPIIALGGSALVWLYGEGFQLSSAELALVGVAAALSPGAYLMNAALLALNRYRQQLLVLTWTVLSGVPFVVFGLRAPAFGVVLACAAALVASVLRFLFSAQQLWASASHDRAGHREPGLSDARGAGRWRSYLLEGLMRPSKMMAKVLTPPFHRVLHRALRRPVGSRERVYEAEKL